MFVKKMQVTGVLLLSLGLLGAGAGVLLSQAPKPIPNQPREDAVARVPVAVANAAAPRGEPNATAPRSRQIHKQLAQVMAVDEIQENTPLKDALKIIGERYKVSLIIDKNAFEAVGIPRVAETPVELPKMTDARLSTVLKRLLKQVPADQYAATYQVRSDHLEITTTYNQMAEAAAEAPDHPALLGVADSLLPKELWGDALRKITPVTHVDADQRPLTEVLRDLAEDAELDIVIDRRAAGKALAPVSLTLNNVLFDSAVSLLVEMADLDWMWVDNVVYVASKEDVKARKERKRAVEQEKLKMLREAAGTMQGGLPTTPTIPAPPPAKPLGHPSSAM